MTIRTEALAALRRSLADRDLRTRVGFGPDAVSTREASSRVLASKVYPPQESWTGRWSWWHQVGEDKLVGDSALVLICEAREGGFHLLVVPRAWLRDHRAHLDWSAKQEKFNLFLSAEADDRFVERRGKGLDFTQWALEVTR